MTPKRKVFVSGCFDLLHSGHIAFFQQAAEYGDLYVALGSDRTVYELKGRIPVNSEQERLYMVRAIGCVTDAFVSRGSGILDFVEELEQLKPDYFVVNTDGNIREKQELCRELGIEYVVLERRPYGHLPPRSTTDLRAIPSMPYRIDLAGGWLDQPWVSKEYPGPVLTISLEPTVDFNERSGMATSTRNKAIELWGPRLPSGDPHKLGRILFAYDNPPGTKYVSGSQDTIGLVLPALNRAHYAGEYWPHQIDSVHDESVLQFVESHLYLIPLGPRHDDFDVLADTRITREGARELADAANLCWDAILARDVSGFGEGVRRSFEAQVAMFPNMVNPAITELVEQYRSQALGWKVSGAGGGGYLILVADHPVHQGVKIFIRRSDG